MQLIHNKQIIFYTDDEDPKNDWQLLAGASLAFIIQKDGRFMVVKDRYADHKPLEIIDGDEVERLMQQFLDFESSTALLKDLVRDNKGLNFLGITARVADALDKEA